MSEAPAAAVTLTTSPDWELDYYSRPILEPDGKKRWELLICSSPQVPPSGEASGPSFRWVMPCPASSVNSIWLREALEQALAAAAGQGFGPPRRLRCWRASMRTMVQRAAEGLGLELVPSRRAYALVSWLQEREREVYPQEPGYLAGPLAPPPQPIRPIAVPLPEAARGESWAWATLPLEALAGAAEWELGFAGLVPYRRACPPRCRCQAFVCSAPPAPWPWRAGWLGSSRCGSRSAANSWCWKQAWKTAGC